MVREATAHTLLPLVCCDKQAVPVVMHPDVPIRKHLLFSNGDVVRYQQAEARSEQRCVLPQVCSPLQFIAELRVARLAVPESAFAQRAVRFGHRRSRRAARCLH